MQTDVFMKRVRALLRDLDMLEASTDAGLYLTRRKELNTLLAPYHFIVTSSRYSEHCMLPVYSNGVEIEGGTA